VTTTYYNNNIAIANWQVIIIISAQE